jgi:hypothetical protein
MGDYKSVYNPSPEARALHVTYTRAYKAQLAYNLSIARAQIEHIDVQTYLRKLPHSDEHSRTIGRTQLDEATAYLDEREKSLTRKQKAMDMVNNALLAIKSPK